MRDDLKAKLGYMVPAHIEVQSGAGTNAPAAIFADYDYTVEDGNHGLHQSAKQACEPAIVYVRADALDARDAETKRLRQERDDTRAEAAKQRQRADALERALREAVQTMQHHDPEDQRLPKWSAALAQQPAEQPETLEAQGQKARGEPLADHPTAAERDQDQVRFERAQTQLVYSLADHFALEITDAQARSIAREVLQAVDAGEQDQPRPRCTHTRLVKDRCPVCGKLDDDNRPVAAGEPDPDAKQRS